jgi:hypothetical protein
MPPHNASNESPDGDPSKGMMIGGARPITFGRIDRNDRLRELVRPRPGSRLGRRKRMGVDRHCRATQ